MILHQLRVILQGERDGNLEHVFWDPHSGRQQPEIWAGANDPFAFAELQAFTSYLCSTLHVAHAHRMRGYRWASDASSFEDMQRRVPESVGACYGLIETRMLRGPWVMGENYTIADPYLFTIAQWLEDDGVDPRRIPRVIEHRSRMGNRASVKKAVAEEIASSPRA
jgi:glutathione S-transferase